MSVSPLSRSLRKSLLPVNPFVFSYPLGRGGWASTLFLFLLVFHWVINWKGVSMRKLLKRFAAAASAVVICGVTCVTSWFSVPVSAVGVFSPFNFYQLYQMLHGLLLGDGGGNSQTFGEWLEKNMTRTVGSGNSKQEFLITPGMKLSDMMDEASMRLMLGAACSDGGFAGISKMKDLIDSWTEVYDTSDIGEIGNSAGSGNVYHAVIGHDDIISISDVFSSNGVDTVFDCDNPEYSTKPVTYRWEYDRSFSDLFFCNYVVDGQTYSLFFSSHNNFNALLYVRYFNTSFFGYSSCSFSPLPYNGLFYCVLPFSCPFISSSIPPVDLHLTNSGRAAWDVLDVLCPGGAVDFQIGGLSNDFIGPVYAMPAAKQLITDTGTLSGLRLDVQTEDGTPDISAALDHAGVDSVDDLVSGVAAGTIPMSQVYEDMRVVPYVLTDVETGQVVTDLNVSATDAKTKAVALDKTLSIPKDVSAADAYQVTGKTWDPSLSKYKLPLFNFFPFCLPWDIYQVLSAFAADPVAPSITVPVGKFFSGKKSFDGSAAADITATIDLGDDKFSKWFVMLRALESAGIVIGLVLVSVKLIHGGR